MFWRSARRFSPMGCTAWRRIVVRRPGDDGDANLRAASPLARTGSSSAPNAVGEEGARGQYGTARRPFATKRLAERAMMDRPQSDYR